MGAKSTLSKKKLQKVFKLLDKDKNGSISLKEVSASIQTVKKGGESFFNSLVSFAGYNTDKEINLEEFE